MVTIRLADDDALVLFDLPTGMPEDADASDLSEPPARQVLWKLEAVLESELVEPLQEDYAAMVARARARFLDLLGE